MKKNPRLQSESVEEVLEETVEEFDDSPSSGPYVRAEWRNKASCGTIIDVDLTFALAWIIRENPNAKRAKSICDACPVKVQCLKDAIADPNSFGLRGGYFFENGVVRRPAAREILEKYGLEARTSQKQKLVK